MSPDVALSAIDGNGPCAGARSMRQHSDVMAALVAAIHVAPPHRADMDARNKSAHDDVVVD